MDTRNTVMQNNTLIYICSSETGKQWQPKLHNKICSAHFIGNRKSEHPHNPSYNPTVFPKVINFIYTVLA